MQLSILTPDEEVFKGEVSSVSVPGLSGRFEVLNNHAPIISALGLGSIKIKTNAGHEMHWHISSGYLEVINNEVSLLVQGLEDLQT